jgi:hypothetical protein
LQVGWSQSAQKGDGVGVRTGNIAQVVEYLLQVGGPEFKL